MFVLPPVPDIEFIVKEELPQGHELVSIEVVKDEVLTQGTAPFALLIRMREEPEAPEAAGVGFDITERIRKRFRAEDVQIRFSWEQESSDDQ